MEMRCYRKMLRISYRDHVTSEEVHAKIQQANGPYEDVLTIVKRRKLRWHRHVSRSSGLATTILQGTVKGGRRQGKTEEEVGRQHHGMDKPGVRQVPEGSGEQRKMRETGLRAPVVPQRPPLLLRDKRWVKILFSISQYEQSATRQQNLSDGLGQ